MALFFNEMIFKYNMSGLAVKGEKMDQCKYCKLKDNFKICYKTDCNIHKSTYAKKLEKDLLFCLDYIHNFNMYQQELTANAIKKVRENILGERK